MQGEPGRYALVGSGWRSELFLRIARDIPDRFSVAGVVTRTAERAEQIAQRWSVPGYMSIDDLLAAETPEFVVSCVPWAETPDTVRALTAAGVRVLAETPPAADLDGLRALWQDVGATGLVQVAEQYLLMPAHAVRHALVREGVIGEVGSVQVCSTHLYHATSLIRHLLGVGFAPAVVAAQAFEAPLIDPLGKEGWIDAPKTPPTRTTLATLDFGGRMGLYDFTDNQWFNPLRGRRIIIRGSLGEIDTDTVTRYAGERSIVSSPLVRRRAGVDLDLTGVDLDNISVDGEVRYRNRFFGARVSEDDLAVVELLDAVISWARDEGPAPYPLADGCQDHLLGLAIEESLRRGASVQTTHEAWAR